MENKGKIIVEIFIGLIFVSILVVLAALFLEDITEKRLTEVASNSTTQFILIDNDYSQTISPVGEGITSLSATRKNQIWLEFDGINDVVIVNATSVKSISFWYKNSTTDWQHIINASGTTYVNGSIGTPLLYPIYNNDSDIHIGKSNGSNFVDVYIDDFRTYSIQIDATQVQNIFNGGRG